MRTVRGSSHVYPSMHWAGGYVSQHALGRGCLPREVSSQGGCLPREGVCPEVGVCPGGVCPGVKTLPCHNYIADGNKSRSLVSYFNILTDRVLVVSTGILDSKQHPLQLPHLNDILTSGLPSVVQVAKVYFISEKIEMGLKRKGCDHLVTGLNKNVFLTGFLVSMQAQVTISATLPNHIQLYFIESWYLGMILNRIKPVLQDITRLFPIRTL